MNVHILPGRVKASPHNLQITALRKFSLSIIVFFISFFFCLKLKGARSLSHVTTQMRSLPEDGVPGIHK